MFTKNWCATNDFIYHQSKRNNTGSAVETFEMDAT
jgi:hypothetical protein